MVGEKFYRILNKKTGIASCKVKDIPTEYIEQLGSMNDRIEKELTFFYYKKDDLIILNEDHPNYENYRDIVDGFLSMNDSVQEKATVLARETPLGHAIEILYTICR